MGDILFVVIPYFNFNDNTFAEKNLFNTINDFIHYSNVKLIISEGVLKSSCYSSNELPQITSKHVAIHLKTYYEDKIWVKENLINIALNSGIKWEYAAWIDKDIIFLNKKWAFQTLKKLKTSNIIQPYSKCKMLNLKGKFCNTETNFFNEINYKNSGIVSFCYGTLGKKLPKKAAMHPGHAWAITNEFYTQIGGLYDLAIVGGFDSLLINCIQQNIRDSKNIYGYSFEQYYKKFKHVRIDYTPGTIFHRFHGKLKNRNYENRLQLFTERGFNVSTEIIHENNLIKLTETGKLYKDFLNNFFSIREL